MKNKTTNTKDITKIAIMATLVFLATYSIKIPSLHGYTHLGDSMIFVAVLILGTKKGALAGGLGAGLADLLGGYMHWIIPTFFIKFFMAIIMGTIVYKALTNFKYNWLIGACLGGLFQIASYTLVKIPMFGIAYAISGLITLTAQTTSGVIISGIIMAVLYKSKAILKLRRI